MHVAITASDGTQSIDKTFTIKVVASSQVLPPEITNTDVSVVENSSSGDGNMHITNSCDGTLGSEFVIIDDFKTSAGGGKSHGSSSSIYISSTESAKQKGLLPIEQALTVEQTNMPPKPLLLRLPI
jgi:hypothetical protein